MLVANNQTNVDAKKKFTAAKLVQANPIIKSILWLKRMLMTDNSRPAAIPDTEPTAEQDLQFPPGR